MRDRSWSAIAVALAISGTSPALSQGSLAPEDLSHFGRYAPTPVSYHPRMSSETLPWDLARVAGIAELELSPEARQLLATNGFVVVKSRGRPNPFEAYADAASRGVATHLPADLFLHVHALVLSRVVSTIEDEVLVDGLDGLARSLLDALLELAPPEHDPAATLALAWAAVFAGLGGDLSGTPIAVEPAVALELAHILAADGLRVSPLFEREIDYSRFRPTPRFADPARTAYYLRLVWAGIAGFRLEADSKSPEGAAARWIARALDRARIGDVPARRFRLELASTIQFFSGSSDELDFEALFPDAGRAAWRERPESFPLGDPGGPAVRFLPPTSLPDAFILERLAHPHVGSAEDPRLFPSGLDVFAVFGAPRALRALDETGASRYPGLREARVDLAERFAPFLPFDEARWGQTLYWGFCHATRPLFSGAPESSDAPWAFARTEAWADRELGACLAAWTENQLEARSASSRRPRPETPPAVPGTILLPSPVFLARLEALVRMAREGLLDRPLLAEALQRPGEAGSTLEFLERFENLLARSRALATLVREGRPLDPAGRAFLSGLADELARLPVHPLESTGARMASVFTLRVRDRGAYHLLATSGPFDDLVVIADTDEGPRAYLGPSSRWAEGVVPDPIPEVVPAFEAPAFANRYSAD